MPCINKLLVIIILMTSIDYLQVMQIVLLQSVYTPIWIRICSQNNRCLPVSVPSYIRYALSLPSAVYYYDGAYSAHRLYDHNNIVSGTGGSLIISNAAGRIRYMQSIRNKPDLNLICEHVIWSIILILPHLMQC